MLCEGEVWSRSAWKVVPYSQLWVERVRARERTLERTGGGTILMLEWEGVGGFRCWWEGV